MKYAEFVDPFIGVDGGGNCLCGPYLPLSLVRLSPDTKVPQATSGYRTNDPIIRFSHTHVSGTGGLGRYGNIGITPGIGDINAEEKEYEKENEEASPGYYRVGLKPAGIIAELSSTQRTGFHRYTFPKDAKSNMVVDLGSIVQVNEDDPNGEIAASLGGFFEYISDTEIIGRADLKGGWGHRFPYSVYFYLISDTAFLTKKGAKGKDLIDAIHLEGANIKAVVEFGEVEKVELRVGISFVSIAKARASVERESLGKSFDEIRKQAVQTWEETFTKIAVAGGSADDMKMFYTMMYRLYCMPADLGIDDEMANWHSGIRHFSDYYCIWDSVRAANSLFALIDPELEVDMINCLLDVADHIGWIPDAWIVSHGAHIQGGSSADVLISEAAQKGLRGIDYEKGLKQMRKNNEVESPDPHLYGRYLPEYRDLGYVSTNTLNCASRHIEYTYQDWCIAKLAEILGQKDVQEDYLRSSQKIWNLWREDLKVFGPKNPDGSWAEFNPNKPSRWDYWNDPHYYEGTGAEWTLTAFHVIDDLIEKHGGPAAFEAYLDKFFESDRYSWKEIILHTPYLYHYVGKPHRSVDMVRKLIKEKYFTTRKGLPDNEDMGAQSSFWICSAIGLYPIMGQDLYFLTTPFFENIEISLGANGKTLKISAPGAEGPNGKTRYITEAKINGQPVDSAFLRHSQIAAGGVMELELADEPGDWGRG